MSNPINNGSTTTLGRTSAIVSFLGAVEGDCIPDDKMAEIAERIVVVIDDSKLGPVKSELPPQDLSRMWYQPSTSSLFAYDADTATWVEVNADTVYPCLGNIPQNLIKRDDSGCLYVIISADENNLLKIDEAGDLVLYKGDLIPVEWQTKTFGSNGAGDATLTVNPLLINDANSPVTINWKADPGANGRWFITTQTADTISITFKGLTASTSFTINVGIHRLNY
jgi:hypothetical protein